MASKVYVHMQKTAEPETNVHSSILLFDLQNKYNSAFVSIMRIKKIPPKLQWNNRKAIGNNLTGYLDQLILSTKFASTTNCKSKISKKVKDIYFCRWQFLAYYINTFHLAQ